MTFTRNTIACLLLSAGSLGVSAQTFTTGGLTYSITSEEAATCRVENDNSLPSTTKEVTIPSSVKYNGKSYDVTEIKEYAFSANLYLQKVTISEGVKTIGHDAFYQCSKLTSVAIANSVEVIGDYAFRGSYYITDINIPTSIKSIGRYAFDGVKATSYTLPEGLESIGGYAFSGQQIAEITIPASVAYIGEGVVASCGRMERITVAPGNPYYSSGTRDDMIYDLRNKVLIAGLATTVVPEGAVEIGQAAFANNTTLASINLPKGLKKISSEAFTGCSNLNNVVIPATVEEIGSYAFWSCTSLKSLTSLAVTPPTIYSGTFGQVYAGFKEYHLHVAPSAEDAYKADEYWTQYYDVYADVKMCSAPSFTIEDGFISVTSETEGAECHVSYSLAEVTKKDGATNIVPQITITAYATAEGYYDSDEASIQMKLKSNTAEGDVNGDGTVSISDVSDIIGILLEKKD